jgi:hypothetical protein
MLCQQHSLSMHRKVSCHLNRIRQGACSLDGRSEVLNNLSCRLPATIARRCLPRMVSYQMHHSVLCKIGISSSGVLTSPILRTLAMRVHPSGTPCYLHARKSRLRERFIGRPRCLISIFTFFCHIIEWLMSKCHPDKICGSPKDNRLRLSSVEIDYSSPCSNQLFAHHCP